MDPGASLIGPLGWVGWVIGVVSGLLQIYLWRRDRRIGPAKEQLFEEALRDREGQYSNAQIQDLKKVLRRLENATRTEVPRQARQVFIENQLETVSDSVSSGVKQYGQLSRELEQLTGCRPRIPAEIEQAIDSSIVSQSVERSRKVLRLYALGIFVLAALAFPGFMDSVVYLPLNLLPDGPYPFGLENTVYYLTGLVIASMVAFTITGPRMQAAIRRNPISAAILCALSLILWASGVVYIGIALASLRTEGAFHVTGVISVGSVVLFGIGLRISALLMRERSIRSRPKR